MIRFKDIRDLLASFFDFICGTNRVLKVNTETFLVFKKSDLLYTK